MQHTEIIKRLSRRIDSPPSDVLYCITMQDVLTAIVHRMEEEALSLSAEELQLAREEVRAALEHHLDPRDYIDMGLDAWEIAINL